VYCYEAKGSSCSAAERFISLYFSSKKACQFRIFRNEGAFTKFSLLHIKDHNGFMWFGTQAGLNKFDGYKFRQNNSQSRIIYL
jgi:hypothetical protein